MARRDLFAAIPVELYERFDEACYEHRLSKVEGVVEALELWLVEKDRQAS